MKIVGRRWARLDDIIQPGYVASLSNMTQQYQSQDVVHDIQQPEIEPTVCIPQTPPQNTTYQQPQTMQQNIQPNYSSDRTNYTHEYLLDNGQIINTAQAYDMAKQGYIEGVTCSTNKGTKYIRMIGDGNMHNNLDDLPEF